VLPLQYKPGESAASHHFTGEEFFEILNIESALAKVGKGPVTVTVSVNGKPFDVLLRIDTPQEVLYYQHGGILPYVLRQLAK